MLVNKMDVLQTSSCESNLKQVPNSNESEQTNFRNISHSVGLLEDLQSLRKNEVLCDIKFKTDDGTIIFGHQNVLVAASPYFRAMLSTFGKTNNHIFKVIEFDSTSFKLLVDYIYTGEIMIKNENVQSLLSAANILQLHYVNIACAEFLETRLDPSNCIGINELADLHNCTKLLSISEAFIHKHFLEVVKHDEFLSLSFEKVIQLISCNNIAVPSEEKVFECVIKWMKDDLNERKHLLPELMEHVRLPLLASKPVILKNVLEEPLLKNSPKYNDLVFEVLHFNLLKSIQDFTIPQTIRYQSRQFGGLEKVILLFNWSTSPTEQCYTEWYIPSTNQRKCPSKMNECSWEGSLGVIKDQFVFSIGCEIESNASRSVSMLDVSLPSLCCVPMADMLTARAMLGVGVIDDCLYAVGGFDENKYVLNSVEVFDVGIQKWRMVTDMTFPRCRLGVGVLNNRLYAIGGNDGELTLRTVECYDPTLDKWTPVAELRICRENVSIGVLDGVIYAIGGMDATHHLKSVEAYRPSDRVWSIVADMHLCRSNSGVVALNGLLYVIGGESDELKINTIEVYNPNMNTWSMETLSRNDNDVSNFYICSGVVVKPPHFITN